MKCFVLKLVFLLYYFQSSLGEASEEIIKRTLYKQIPQDPVPPYLSERALPAPRKIQNSEDWLQHYKTLLQQWNSQQQSVTSDDLGGQHYSNDESQIQQPLPTVVTKYVSPETKNVFYLIGKGRQPTEAPKQAQPQRSANTIKSTIEAVEETTTKIPETTASEIYTTIKKAITSTTSATSESPTISSEAVQKLPRKTSVIDGNLITPEMAGGAALFLTSLLGTFLPVFDSAKDPSESRDSNANMQMTSIASLRPQPNVKTGYAQVARYQGPRQRRRESPNRDIHLRQCFLTWGNLPIPGGGALLGG